MNDNAKIVLLLVSLILQGCTSAPKLNPNLVRPWATELNKEAHSEEAYIAHHKKGEYELFYLAAHHSNDPKSETHQLVKKLFQYDFNFLVIEGFPTSRGINPEAYIEQSKKGSSEKIVLGGEGAVAALLAVDKGIPFQGGEPDHELLYSELLKQGFTRLDFLGFYLIRQIPQWVRQSENKITLLKSKAPEFLSRYCKRLEIAVSDCPALAEISAWYEKHTKKKLTVDIDTEEVAPLSNSSLHTHKISAAIGAIRDRYTLAIVEALIEQHKRVAVVYGASHYLTLKKSFETSLGAADFKDGRQ